MQRAGISYRAAEKAFNWLKQHQLVISPDPNADPKHLGKGATRATQVQCVVTDENPDIAIARSFLDGTPKMTVSPLARLLGEISASGGILRREAVMDAMLLFAALMREQDFGEMAGVNPDAWHQPFDLIEPGEDGDMSEPIMSVPGTTGAMVTVKERRSATSTVAFMQEALGAGSSEDEQMKPRFWHAVAELRRVRLVYRVLVMWQGNPLDLKQKSKAEPVATLYINDSWARDFGDPHLQYGINRAAWRTALREAYSDFNDGIPFLGSGRYRYFVRSGTENVIWLLGQLRVRYWASCESTVLGRQREKERTERWLRSIEQIGRL